MGMIEDFIEQRYNQTARLVVRGKWEDKEDGLIAGQEYGTTHQKDGWEFDTVTSRDHPDGWYWIEVWYRPSDPID